VLPREHGGQFNVGRVQIWAAIGMDWRSPVIFLPDKKDEEGKAYRLNADRYIRLCLSRVVPALLQSRSRLQQDGAKCHTAVRTRNYLARKGVELVDGWPASSPAINVVENMWSILKRRIAERAPQDVAELKRVTVQEWNAIPAATINKLILSYRKRLKACAAGSVVYE
jgi:hypothetical protein